MDDIFNPALRTILFYLLLLVATRLMGRKMISQMTFFDFVVGIVIGSVTAQLTLGPFNSIASGITVLTVLTALVVLIGTLHIKSFRFRKLVDSEPIVMVEKGQIVDKNMKKERFALEDLTALLREKNVFNVADVEFAILEHDGKLSVLPKSDKRPLKPADINVAPSYQGLSKDIILDGIIMKENLADANLSREWLMDQLQMYNIGSLEEVFYAGLDSNNNLYVSKRKQQQEKDGQHGIE